MILKSGKTDDHKIKIIIKKFIKYFLPVGVFVIFSCYFLIFLFFTLNSNYYLTKTQVEDCVNNLSECKVKVLNYLNNSPLDIISEQKKLSEENKDKPYKSLKIDNISKGREVSSKDNGKSVLNNFQDLLKSSISHPTSPQVSEKNSLLMSDNELKMVIPTSDKVDVEKDDVNSFNDLRQTLGLNPVSEEERMDYASDAHAVYMVNNQETDHYEDNSEDSFFAESPYQRLKKAGVSKKYLYSTGEVISSINEDNEEGEGDLLENLFNAIYHRFIMIDPDMTTIGFSERSGNDFTALVMDTSNIEGPRTKLVGVAYPFNGQKNVTPYFDHESEDPDPVPDVDGEVGFAISFSVGSEHSLKISKFTLHEEGSEKEVSGKEILPNKNSDSGDNNFAFIPYKELSLSTTYIAHIQGVADGRVKVDYEWKFTTSCNDNED